MKKRAVIDPAPGTDGSFFCPGRRAADGSVNLRVDLGQLLLERGVRPDDAPLDSFDLHAPAPVRTRRDYLDDLSGPQDEVGEQRGRLVDERA
ncbi:MAG TPA: hypothetical protein VGL12_08905 [Roseiarcus sp.]|jgi:hypothetical protein